MKRQMSLKNYMLTNIVFPSTLPKDTTHQQCGNDRKSKMPIFVFNFLTLQISV